VSSYYIPRWRIFVDYLATTASSPAGFNETVLAGRLETFEIGWQTETWGMNEGEEWSVTGDLLDVLGTVKSKWGDIF
jgi:alpha-N-acetylglucosaminidase